MTFFCIACGRSSDENNFYEKVKNRCNNCLNKKLKCQVCGMFFTKIWLTPHIEREHQSSEPDVLENVNNNNNDSNPNVSKYENHAYVVIGPRNFGQTYYMLKVLRKIGDKRPIHIITKSPNQYPNYKTSTEIKPINKYKGSVVIFDDMLSARNSSQTDEYFT